ncbi:hypothetical protein PVAP13_8KG377104 [Panicum virgatum]|uniref:F-box domain-containing protein n=1 Tax=Panicum virgatum TaxID=38727 RepID=A0A8T0PPS9_PANVG|nr:hypothetical protein PVAP13_8KG377104 [Panicum virgatum]
MEAEAAMAPPNDLLADVLGRLPARSLAASRRVCKAWRDLVDERRLLLRLRCLLPHSLRGLFINYQNYKRPHFFARPAPSGAGDGGAPIDSRFDYIARAREERNSCYEVMDHCNGLVLYWDSDEEYSWRRRLRAFLVFDPAASPAHYKVLLEPVVVYDACHLMEWPASGRWEEVFVRDGESAGTVGDIMLLSLLDALNYQFEPRWRFAAYWQGALYIHCSGEFVSRFSLEDDKYKVIKSPIDLAECKNDVRSFLGRSEKGVYFAAIDPMDILRVWILRESMDQTVWVPKHHSKLKTYSWLLHEQKCDKLRYDARWILDIPNKRRLHPYLGPILHLAGAYNRGQREAFVYTPCLIW